MINAVLFDLDGTLFDRDATVEGILAWQVRTFSNIITPDRAAEFCSRVTSLDEHGHRDKREVYATVAAEFGFDAPVVRTTHHIVLGRISRIIATLTPAWWPRWPNCDAVATSWHRHQRGGLCAERRYRRAGHSGAVDAILISETEGIRKPDPDIFHRAAGGWACSRASATSSATIPAVDIAGAEAAGLHASGNAHRTGCRRHRCRQSMPFLNYSLWPLAVAA